MLRGTMLLSGLLLLAACAAAVPDDLPADWRVELHYAEGSVPPPYHYAYRISLGADGNGSFELTPDYPGAGVPVWQRSFRYDAAALYRGLADGPLFTTRWQQPEIPPIGGAQHWLTVRHGDRIDELPPTLIEAQQPAARAILELVEAQVPRDVRAELMQLRADYEAAYRP